MDAGSYAAMDIMMQMLGGIACVLIIVLAIILWRNK